MKSSAIKITLMLLLFLILAGCKKNYVISDKQLILFQYEYVNYAWGYQHSGFIIDSKGDVLTYNNPDEWNFPDKNFIMTEKQVEENISHCRQSGKNIPEEELLKYSKYINNIASSKVTAVKNVAADAGSLEYICYQFSDDGGSYKGTLIRMEGDFTCENLNFYSKKVAAWMKEINSSISVD